MKIGIGFIVCLMLLIGCKKPPEEPVAETYENGVLFLNEGLFEQNNSSLSFYSFDKDQSFQLAFKSENNRGLGDTANDFEAYSLNGKEYIIIAVDVSSQVEIIERYSLKTVAQIGMFDGENAREPRRVKVNGKFAYVCNFDGTVAIINLDNYEIVKLIEVGANPDGMLIAGNHLFVSNSGGLNYPVYDNTVSVIDLSTNSLISSFETRINSSQMVLDYEGDIYLVSNGNYGDVERALLRIDASSNTVEEVIVRSISNIVLNGDWLYFYNSEEEGIYRMNTLTEVFDETKLIDCSEFETFFRMHIDPELNKFYLVDAHSYVNSSTIHVYNGEGLFIQTIVGGLNTNDLIFN